jgi:hypothetical protein
MPFCQSEPADATGECNEATDRSRLWNQAEGNLERARKLVDLRVVSRGAERAADGKLRDILGLSGWDGPE